MHKTIHRRLCRSALFAMCIFAVLVQGGVAVEAEAGTDFSAVL